MLGRCDGFALGGLLAAMMNDPWVRRHLTTLRVGLGVCVIAVAYLAWGLHTFDERVPLVNLVMSLLFFGLIGLIVCHAGRPALLVPRVGWLCYLGTISYGLYLYHYILINIMENIQRRLGPGDHRWMVPVTLVACFVVAVLSWESVERPILMLKDRFGYRGHTSPFLVLPATVAEVPSPTRV